MDDGLAVALGRFLLFAAVVGVVKIVGSIVRKSAPAANRMFIRSAEKAAEKAAKHQPRA